MSNKNTNTNENLSTDVQLAALLPLEPIVPPVSRPIEYSINTYAINKSSGATITGSVAYCDSNRSICCDISITPGTKFKSIKKVLLLLKNNGGSETGFQVYNNSGSVIYGNPPFAYVDNRYDSNGNITYRVIDITADIKGCKSQTVSLVIESISGNSCYVYTTGALLEIEYLEDDDFIPNVSKLERNVGTKGAYSVNTRNGKLFYTQKLIQGKGGRMPLALSMTYNAADCDTSAPNEIPTGIKGWTFNYAQTLKTSTSDYTLLDGAHMYRTLKGASNTSTVKYDASSKSGLYLSETSSEYIISDEKGTTYKFNVEKRLAEIVTTSGSSVMTTNITYNTDGKIASVTDGMSDTYDFAYASDTITISRNNTPLLELTLEDERLVQVKYLLSNEVYAFTYNSDGELLTVSDSASNEKTVFEYEDSHAIYAVKNYISKNDTDSPVDCYFINYRVLETYIEKCQNSDSKFQTYSKTIYTFAENGETISVCEGGSTGVFKNMRFRSKNDYENYVVKIVDFNNVQNGTSTGGVFTFNEEAQDTSITTETEGYEIQTSNPLTVTIPGYIDSNCIFSAKVLVENSNYKESVQQSIALELKDAEGNVLTTLDFDPKKRQHQVKSSMIRLPYGMNTLQAKFKILNTRTEVQLSEVYIFQTKNSATFEYISDFANVDGIVVNNGERNLYLNKGVFSLKYGDEQYDNIRYTAKDCALTTISRLKNPDTFNIWYNDGANMLAEVGSQWTLEQNGIIKDVIDVKCCKVTMGVNKTVISGVDASELPDGFIKTMNITKVAKESEDENGAMFTDYDNFDSTVHYNEYMKPIRSENEDNIVTEYTYNEFGEVLTEKVFPTINTNLSLLTSRAYHQDGNLASVTEKRYENEYTRMFEYNNDDTLANEITANGQYIYYTHTPDGDKLTELKANVGGMNENDISYTGNLITALEHNSTPVTFEYDERNNVNNIKVAESSILSITTTYGAYNKQTLTEYANGAKIKRYYDKYNRLIKVTEINGENETQLCAYLYSDTEVGDDITNPEDSALNRNSSSKLYVFIDNVANTRTKYVYDEYGALKESQTGNMKEGADKDDYSRPSYTYFNDGSATVSKSIIYENNYSTEMQKETVGSPAGYTSIIYSRDALKRLTMLKTTQGENGYTRHFSYIPRGAANTPEGTTNYIKEVTYYNVVNYESTLEKTEAVEYNTDGNIVRYGENTYEYDRIGRLVRENNKNLDKTYTWVYNEGGNIVSKNEYAYTEGMIEGEPTKTYAYTYGNAWKDQLTNFDGQNIVYDASGNPTSYLGATLSWSKGRLLTQYSKGGTNVTMNYSANGVKRSKISFTLGGARVSTSFIYDSHGKLRTETKDGVTRRYLYSSDGIMGFEENGVLYLYRKNLFGDITAIYKGATKVAEYTYDAWGNCSITYNTNGIGTRNPFRYRGYYYDTDLNLYYLLTRYYDPKTGRFINADSLEYLDPNKINGLNLYAYCGDNPIMYVDPSGHELVALQIIGFLLYMAVLAALIVLEIVLITSVIIEAIQNAQKQKPPQFLPEDVDEENITLPYKPEDTQIIFEGLIKGATTINKTVFPIKDINKNNNFNNNYSGNSWSGSYNSKVNYVSNNSGPKGPFGGAARGDSLWDPVLLVILNEAFTGGLDK